MFCIVENKIHFFHNWSRWQCDNEAKIERKYDQEEKYVPIGLGIIQKRVCKTCGLVENMLTRINV